MDAAYNLEWPVPKYYSPSEGVLRFWLRGNFKECVAHDVKIEQLGAQDPGTFRVLRHNHSVWLTNMLFETSSSAPQLVLNTEKPLQLPGPWL